MILGAVRVTLKAPLDGISSSDYCKSAAQPCLFWNENDILYEPGVDGALITTRAQIKEYGPFSNSTSADKNHCDVNIPTTAGCDPHRAPSTLLLPTSLVADIERFTLMLEHSIRGQATGIQIRSGNMEYGVLRDTAGQVIKTFSEESRYVPATPATVALSNDSITTTAPVNSTVHIASNATSTATTTGTVHLAGDVMTVGEFLKAAGVDLDSLSGSPTASANETVRSSGVVVIVVIQYAAKGWNPNRISYEYLPKAIPDQEYKVIETIRDFRGGNRVEINRHGIRIVFSQAGQLGQFSLMTLLTNLVAAIALFKVANIVVELMMLRLHPHKKIYDRAKFENTKDGKGKKKKEEPGVNEKAVTDLQIGDGFEQEDDTVHDHSGRGSSNGEPSKSHKQGHNTRSANHGNLDRSGYCAESSEEENEDEDESDIEYSESDDGEQDERKVRSTAQPPTDHLTLRLSSSQDQATIMEHGHASSIYNSSKELHRRSKTPVSNNGTFGRSSSASLGKSVDYMGTVDWSRNGSSSGLMNNDSRPGIAKAASYSRRPQSAAEDAEIETRFGPIRPNEFKGFNPGGLVIGGSTSIPSPPQTKIAYSFARGAATPEMRPSTLLSTPTNKIGPAAILHSPPSMQAASPNPVFFGPETTHSRVSASGPSNTKNQSRRHSRQYNSESKDQKSSSPERHVETSGRLSSRHSSSSLSSLSSSSSLSSCEGACANDGRTLSTSMSFGLGSGLNSSSTWSFGVPESPVRGYCSGGESVSGLTPKSEKAKFLHASASNPNLSASTSGAGYSAQPIARHGHKKHKTDKHRPALTEHSNSSSSLFNLGSPSNHSKLSLTLTSESWLSDGDVKGKRPVSAGFSSHGAGSSSSKKPVFGPNAFTSSSASPSPLRRSSLATDTTTTVFNMTPFQLPTPAFPGQDMDIIRQKQDESSSTELNVSSTTLKSSSLRGKDIQQIVRDRTLRTSSSSPSLLNGSSSGSGPTGWKVTGSSSSSGLTQSSESLQHHSKELRVAIPPSLSSASAQVVPRPASCLSGSGAATSMASTSVTARSAHTQIPLQSATAHESALPFRSGTVAFGPASSSSEFPPDSGFQVSTPSTPAFMLATQSDGPPSSISFSCTRPFSAYLDYSNSGVSTPSCGTPSTRPLPSIPATSNTSTPTSTSYPTTRTFGSSSTPNLLLHNNTSALDVSSTVRSGPYLSGGNNYSSPSLGLMTSSSESGASSANANNHYYPHPTSTFFTSPITSSCTTTLAGTGIRVLGRTITMITADNKKLLLRRSEPLILNEGVGEEKAARM
ncbi:cytochrome c oxidase subunit 1 [Podila minutissima]|nr:cytochrome c oxidase subunit 1 [Podila minutissima]